MSEINNNEFFRKYDISQGKVALEDLKPEEITDAMARGIIASHGKNLAAELRKLSAKKNEEIALFFKHDLENNLKYIIDKARQVALSTGKHEASYNWEEDKSNGVTKLKYPGDGEAAWKMAKTLAERLTAMGLTVILGPEPGDIKATLITISWFE